MGCGQVSRERQLLKSRLSSTHVFFGFSSVPGRRATRRCRARAVSVRPPCVEPLNASNYHQVIILGQVSEARRPDDPTVPTRLVVQRRGNAHARTQTQTNTHTHISSAGADVNTRALNNSGVQTHPHPHPHAQAHADAHAHARMHAGARTHARHTLTRTHTRQHNTI